MQSSSPIKHLKNTTIVNRMVSHLTLDTLDASHQSVFEDFSNTFQNPALHLQQDSDLFMAWEALTQALLKKFIILVVFYMNTDHALQEIETLCNMLEKTHTWPLTKLNFFDLVQTLHSKLRLPQPHSRVKHYYQTLEKTLNYYTKACDQWLKSQCKTTMPYPPRIPNMLNLNQGNLSPLLLLLKEKLIKPPTDTTTPPRYSLQLF